MKLPASPAAFATATWADVLPYYEQLAAQPIDATTLTSWLRDWSQLESLLSEAASLAMIGYTCNTGDREKEAAHLRFSTEILPKAEEQSVRLARRLVEQETVPEGMEHVVARFRASIEIFREANVPLFAELEELSSRYQRMTGGMLALWEGTERPLPMLTPFLQAADRGVRERAFRAMVTPYVEQRDALAAVFDELYARRQAVARNANFSDYHAFSFVAKHRFDYTPGDCARFHDAVESIVVPAHTRALAARRDRLRLETLRPWDLAVNPYRAEPLRPFEGGDALARGVQRMLAALDPVLGGEFATMIEERLLDLDSRKDKAPGGYCDTLHVRGRPFIFMNASGVLEDVMTLLHESGHAFHAFAAHQQPYVWQRHPGAEAAELASMSMELLAGPHLGLPAGMLSERDAAIARLEHLEDALASLPHIASVDAFQTWIYTSGEGHDAVARDAAWLRIRGRFEEAVDWSGLLAERTARWYRQLHIYLYPFYYIEYGIAQLGALQVWRNHRQNGPGALEAYRRFLSLGATRTLPELYREAGASLVFDPVGMRPLVDLIEEEMDRLRAVAG
ncbi:MAG TPA: M3 family oligoendopeptidase [Gemmatimonadales bacterium]|jgi:oligoendopeptidase F|nr:M3 family oligoendopeptidase [Gemmatimonadales bacterium]